MNDSPSTDMEFSDFHYSDGPPTGLFHACCPPYERRRPAPPDAAPRFLLIRLSSIGDVVVTTAAARELKKRYPNCLVVAAVEEKAEPITSMNSYVDEVFLFRVKTLQHYSKRALSSPAAMKETLRGLSDLSARLKGYRFDAAVDMHGMFRSGLLAQGSGAPKRIGYAGTQEMSYLFRTHSLDRKPLFRPGEEALRLLEPLGVTDADPSLHLQPRESAYRIADQLLAETGLSPSRTVALCPATTHPAKHWTEAGWAAVTDGLQEQMGLQPVFLGGPADHELIGRINALAHHPAPSLAGRTTLEESTALVDRCALTVAVDTGLAHISIAMMTPVVILHGSTPFERMRREPNVTVVAHPDACGYDGTDTPCPNCACTSRIQPEEVLQAASRLISPPAEPIISLEGTLPPSDY